MGNFALPLFRTPERIRVHKSLVKAADMLEDMGSLCFGLRKRLHYESARCEVANGLLIKGQAELSRAAALDTTLAPGQEGQEFQQKLEAEGEDIVFAAVLEENQ